MTEGSAPQYQGANGEEKANAWGIGLILFASLLMMLGGAFQPESTDRGLMLAG